MFTKLKSSDDRREEFRWKLLCLPYDIAEGDEHGCAIFRKLVHMIAIKSFGLLPIVVVAEK